MSRKPSLRYLILIHNLDGRFLIYFEELGPLLESDSSHPPNIKKKVREFVSKGDGILYGFIIGSK
jgi:hypothetical protein